MPKVLCSFICFLGCPLKAKSTATIETRGLKWCVMYMCRLCFQYLCQEHNVRACKKVHFIPSSHTSAKPDRNRPQNNQQMLSSLWRYAELPEEQGCYCHEWGCRQKKGGGAGSVGSPMLRDAFAGRAVSRVSEVHVTKYLNLFLLCWLV